MSRSIILLAILTSTAFGQSPDSEATSQLDLAFRTQLRQAIHGKNLPLARSLFDQWDVFHDSGKLPTHVLMKPAVDEYRDKLTRSHGAIDKSLVPLERRPSAKAIENAKAIAKLAFSTTDDVVRIESIGNWRIEGSPPVTYEGKKWLLWETECAVSVGGRPAKLKSWPCYISGDDVQDGFSMATILQFQSQATKASRGPARKPLPDAPAFPGGLK